jgi:hypothetical protein
MPRVPITRVRTTHALTIKANGHTIGLINGWSPTQGRTATPVFEVGTDNSGNPTEIVPGNVSGLSVSINRFDAYVHRMEEAFGTPDLVMLTRQNQPFDIIEVWKIPNLSGGYNNLIRSGAFTPSGAATTVKSDIYGDIPVGVQASSDLPTPFVDEERFVYSGCWFTSIGRTLRSDDNRIVNVNATIMYTKKLKIAGFAGRIAAR